MTQAPSASRLPVAPLDTLTPAMRQYVEQKQRVGDAILLFRMGDFYETFYDDAVLCSKVLGIALTSRDKSSKNPVPLAGIPHHALESYLGKLVAAGYKVAISEQLEDPKQAKGVVRRDVVRIVTAGTLTDDALLSQRDDNVLAAVLIHREQTGLAVVELASGRFETIDVADGDLLHVLVRLRPAELLIEDERNTGAESLAAQLRDLCGTVITRRPVHEFGAHRAKKSLFAHFGVSTLSGFGFDDMTPSLRAAGCIVEYLQETQKAALLHITAIRQRTDSETVRIDQSSWRALEIDQTLRGGRREGSLLHSIDRTIHPAGGRMLRRWLTEPLTDITEIRRRQQAVAFFFDEGTTRVRIRQGLRTLADVERVSARVALGRASPRDLDALRRTLGSLPSVIQLLTSDESHLVEILHDFSGCSAYPNTTPAMGSESADPTVIQGLADLLHRAIRPEPANNLREGGFIADGFDDELDRLRSIRRDGHSWLADYQKAEIARTGITHLKAGFNRVFGYYLEVPHSARDRVPQEYARKQTVKNAERYITEALKNHEQEVLTAEERANQLEFDLFEKLRGAVAERLTVLLRVAQAIARLDVVSGLAELAVERRYTKPEIVDDGRLDIVDGRHPVLDQVLGDAFVPNDAFLGDDARVFVITGPNMAGKSTYIRQVALLTVLAQIGSFVPARRMVLSPVDRIFARVGSSDELMRGQSTFMVEMTEAANILHNATRSSLVILDELGRGTSTFDGLSLAWAITEHLASEVGCRTLVATHYHELIELASLLKNVRNYNVAVKECSEPVRSHAGLRDSKDLPSADRSIVFLHKIVEGGASQSYGIQVARLAGIPKAIINRSREVLDELQRGLERESRSPQFARRKTRDEGQLTLFRDPAEELLELLRSIDPERMTPIQALDVLKKMKDRFG